MGRYTIELKYVAAIRETVEANDEGEALEKARTCAEDADLEDYTIVEELESYTEICNAIITHWEPIQSG